MRTNIDIDDDLMRRAMAASEETTKKAVVEKALRLMVRLKAQEGIRKWRGKLKWESDLESMRATRFPDWDTGSEAARQRLEKISGKRGK